MTTENWRDDHIPEPQRSLRRRLIEAEWEVRRLQRIIEEAEADLDDAVKIAAECSAAYRAATEQAKAGE